MKRKRADTRSERTHKATLTRQQTSPPYRTGLRSDKRALLLIATGQLHHPTALPGPTAHTGRLFPTERANAGSQRDTLNSC